MANPFTIRIFVSKGDPEGVRIIDRLNSTGTFYAFPRTKWNEIKDRAELNFAGIYILSGYAKSEDELPTIYVGQADSVRKRLEQHLRSKDFWDRAVVFVSAKKLNATHAKWLEHALVKRAAEANRSILENGNSPQEPTISESERADMRVFLTEIYQTLPLVGFRAFEIPKSVSRPVKEGHVRENIKDTIIVPAREDGFKEVFLCQNEWYAVRIAGGMLDKINYIAAYQSNPISAVTYWAPVEKIESYGEEGKYKLIFSEPAHRLEKPIEYGDAPRGYMQGIRYTSFKKLENAKQVTDLFN